MEEDKVKWRKYMRGVANPWVEDGTAKEQNWTTHW